MATRHPIPFSIFLSWASGLLVPSLASAQCGIEWEEGIFPDRGFSGEVHCAAEFDDGSGPALYVGGDFARADGVTVNSIARWDGSAWQPLGSGLLFNANPANVYALAVFDDGNGPALYAGGNLTSAGGVAASCTARWDGSSWSPLGSGIGGGSPPDVRTLAVFDDGSGPALYAGGYFTQAGGASANRIARWNGSSWSRLGTGIGGAGLPVVYGLEVYNDGSGAQLHAIGKFTTAGGVAVEHVARWNGTAWSAVGAGVTFYDGRDLAVFDDGSGPRLFAAARFLPPRGSIQWGVVRWDGSTWTQLGPAFGGSVIELGTHEPGSGSALVVTGAFSTIGVTNANRIARWDGSAWVPLGDGLGSTGDCLLESALGPLPGPTLYVGGSFQTASTWGAQGFAAWDGAAWQPLELGGGIAGPSAFAVAAYDDGSGPALYVGGRFPAAGGRAAANLARWDGSSWSEAGGTGGSNPQVHTMAVFDDGLGPRPALYVGGQFSSVGGVAATAIGRWDGNQWSAPGGLSNTATIVAMTVFDDGLGGGPALYVAGSFFVPGLSEGSNIARWDGTQWSAVGHGISSSLNALVVHDDGSGPALYVGGNFTEIDGIPGTAYIARWDGLGWSAVGSGMNGGVAALTVHDDGTGAALYAGGGFQMAGGQPAARIASWDGVAWSALGRGLNDQPFALVSYEPPSESHASLFAGGRFTTAGGNFTPHVARFDGTSWSGVDAGTDSRVYDFAMFDDGLGGGPALYAVGDFVRAGSVSASHVARTHSPAGLSVASVAPRRGSWLGGETVTLTGAGFTPGTLVSFDGILSPTVTLLDPTHIEAVVPGPSGPSGRLWPTRARHVDVTASNGVCDDTLADGYTYRAGPSYRGPCAAGGR